MDRALDTKKEEMILAHLPLVEKVVNRMHVSSAGLDRDDLISIGSIGLMDAVDKYDPDQAASFEQYARLRIKGTIMDELRRLGKVSRSRIQHLNDYYQAKADLEQKLMRSPSQKEISQHLGLEERQLSNIHETMNILPSVSLEQVLFGSGGGLDFYDLLEDPAAAQPEKLILGEEMAASLQAAIGRLEDRDQAILSMYYVDELTLKEIGHVFDISVPRVSQIHRRILDKLRTHLQKKGGKES